MNTFILQNNFIEKASFLNDSHKVTFTCLQKEPINLLEFYKNSRTDNEKNRSTLLQKMIDECSRYIFTTRWQSDLIIDECCI